MPLLRPKYPDYSDPAVLSALEAAHAVETREVLIASLTHSIETLPALIRGIRVDTSLLAKHAGYANKTLQELFGLELDFETSFKKLEQARITAHLIGAITLMVGGPIALSVMLLSPPVGLIGMGVCTTAFIIAEFKRMRITELLTEIHQKLPAVREYIKKGMKTAYEARLAGSIKLLERVKAQPLPVVTNTLTSVPRVDSSLSDGAAFFARRRRVKPLRTVTYHHGRPYASSR